MYRILLLGLLGYLVSQAGAQNNDQILRPIKEGTDVGIVIIPGGFLYPEQYQDLGVALQNNSDLRLWVYLADSLVYLDVNDYVVPSAPEETIIGDAKNKLREAGMPVDAPFFSAGHSAGAGLSTLEIVEYPDLAVALIIFGSKLYYPHASFPVPVLMVTGDIDGLNRMGTIAEEFYPIKQEVDGGNADFKYRFPIKFIEGANHMSFTTGPGTIVTDTYDIDAEIEDAVARNIITQSMGTFMNYHTNGEQTEALREVLDDWYDETLSALQPIITIFLMDNETTTESMSWTAQAQLEISSLSTENRQSLQVINTVIEKEFLGLMRPFFEYDFDNLKLISNTFTTPTYDPFPTLVDPNSPYMLEVKMKNSATIAEQLGVTEGEYVSCKDVNQKAWDLVMDSISNTAKERFLRKNINVVFDEDIPTLIGPDWLEASLYFDFYPSISTLLVQSTVLWTDTSVGEDFGGMHYCKLLPPSRALDFIYTDALRNYV